MTSIRIKLSRQDFTKIYSTIFIVVCLLLMGTPSFGQSHSISITYSIDKTSSHVEDDHRLLFPNQSAYAPRFGIDYMFSLSNYFGVKSGIRYAHYNYTSFDNGLIWPSEISEDGVEVVGGNPYKSFKFLEVPFHFLVSKQWKGFSFFVESGLGFYMHVGYPYVEDSHISSFNVSIDFGFGVETKLHKNLSLKLTPLYRHHLNSINSFTVKEYLHSGGVEFSLIYNFQK